MYQQESDSQKIKMKKLLIIILTFTTIGCADDSETSGTPEPIRLNGACMYTAAYTATYAIANDIPYEIIYGILYYEDRHVHHVNTIVCIDSNWWWIKLNNNNTISFSKDLWTEFRELETIMIEELIQRVETIWKK